MEPVEGFFQDEDVVEQGGDWRSGDPDHHGDEEAAETAFADFESVGEGDVHEDEKPNVFEGLNRGGDQGGVVVPAQNGAGIGDFSCGVNIVLNRKVDDNCDENEEEFLHALMLGDLAAFCQWTCQY